MFHQLTRISRKLLSSRGKLIRDPDNCRRAASDAPLRAYRKTVWKSRRAPFILPPWGRAILPDNRGDKFQRDTLYTSRVYMKPAAYRLENNQSALELTGRRDFAKSQMTAWVISKNRLATNLFPHAFISPYSCPRQRVEAGHVLRLRHLVERKCSAVNFSRGSNEPPLRLLFLVSKINEAIGRRTRRV